jgi:hypothetical protein
LADRHAYLLGVNDLEESKKRATASFLSGDQSESGGRVLFTVFWFGARQKRKEKNNKSPIL